MNEILEFYNQHPFPGYYTYKQIANYNLEINRYVNFIGKHLSNGNVKILDVGCGTGLLTNLLALKYPKSFFTGIDFSYGADFAKNFAIENDIKNVNYVKQDFFSFVSEEKYDIIIAQSFLTHVKDFKLAVEKIKNLLKPDGIILLGVYHPVGKILKNFLKINYGNERLKIDQELCPYEISFSKKEIKNMFSNFQIKEILPSLFNKFVGFANFLNYKNGGLTLYALKSNNQKSVEIENDIWNWIKNFIEVPHEFYDYKFAVCPYAQSARLKGIVNVKVYENENFKDFIENSIKHHLQDTKHEIMILTFPPKFKFKLGIAKYITDINKRIIQHGYYCQYGDAVKTNSKYQGILNYGSYFIILVNKLEPVLDGHQMLLKTDYYKKWSSKHYNNVVDRRQQMYDNYKDG